MKAMPEPRVVTYEHMDRAVDHLRAPAASHNSCCFRTRPRNSSAATGAPTADATRPHKAIVTAAQTERRTR